MLLIFVPTKEINIMTTQILRTNEKTINKKVKAQILDLLLPGQTITKVKKMHVAGCGYVMYYKNKFGVTLVNACKDNGQITLRYSR